MVSLSNHDSSGRAVYRTVVLGRLEPAAMSGCACFRIRSHRFTIHMLLELPGRSRCARRASSEALHQRKGARMVRPKSSDRRLRACAALLTIAVAIPTRTVRAQSATAPLPLSGRSGAGGAVTTTQTGAPGLMASVNSLNPSILVQGPFAGSTPGTRRLLGHLVASRCDPARARVQPVGGRSGARRPPGARPPDPRSQRADAERRRLR